MTRGSRATALELLNQVTFEDAYANLALSKILSGSRMSARDKSFTQELAFGTLRFQLTYDSIIGAVSSRSISQIDAKLLNCLRLGCHQILRMRVPDHAAISETVDLVRGTCGEKVVGFANGILRSVTKKTYDQWLAEIAKNDNEVESQSIKFSHPTWIIEAYRSALKADGLAGELENLLSVNNISPAVNLIALPNLADRPAESDVIRHNMRSPFGFALNEGNPVDLSGFESGLLRVQDEGSQLAALALAEFGEAKTGERWLDLCAGPGGKSAVLAALAESRSIEFVANEPIEHRATLVAQALKPIGQFKIYTEDGRRLSTKVNRRFDRIIVDAPCTGLGALRRRPEARWRKSNEDLKQLCRLQFELLQSAYELLEEGGLCLYVTCSPHLSETTAIVHKASQQLGFEVEDLTRFMNSKYFAGSLPTNRKTVQLFTHRDGTDSMFLAMLRKPAKAIGLKS